MKRLITYIGLLRGINVAGPNKIPMSDLCTLCAKIGYCDVQTYIRVATWCSQRLPSRWPPRLSWSRQTVVKLNELLTP